MNLANKYGFTALILAAGMGNLDIVSKLTPRLEVNVKKKTKNKNLTKNSRQKKGERELRRREPLLGPHDRLHARLPPHC